MAIMAKETGNDIDYTPVPQGTHLAVCNMVVDIGLQETTYMGETKIKHQVYVRWELPHERLKYTDGDGKEHEGPMVVGKTYTLSLNEKANLRKDLEAWRGKSFTASELDGFDLLNLLGVCCQITVTHREKDNKTYSNVTGVAGWPKGMDKINAQNPLLAYSDDDKSSFDDLPQWLREKINNQKEPAVDPGPSSEIDYGADLDDDIPF